MVYILVSLTTPKEDRPRFVQENGELTVNPFIAALFSQDSIDGFNLANINTVAPTIAAIPVTNDALAAVGFKCNIDFIELEKYLTTQK